MTRVDFHPEAERELEEGFAWYESQASGLGADFLDAVDCGIRAIRERPHAWPVIKGTVRRYLVHRFPYGLVYDADEERVRVLAVMHLHRRPGYWQARTRL